MVPTMHEYRGRCLRICREVRWKRTPVHQHSAWQYAFRVQKHGSSIFTFFGQKERGTTKSMRGKDRGRMWQRQETDLIVVLARLVCLTRHENSLWIEFDVCCLMAAGCWLWLMADWVGGLSFPIGGDEVDGCISDVNLDSTRHEA